QSFSKSERKIANAINRFPVIKRGLKIAYQTLSYFLYRKTYKYKCIYPLETIQGAGETFFGYYDKSPISENNRYILFHESNHPTSRIPSKDKGISVAVFDLEANNLLYKKEIRPYNWQQGSRLQWLGENKFIFNNFDEERGYHSVVTTSSEGGGIEENLLSIPIYDCYGDKFALSLNFKRLNLMRPDYGYRNHPDITNIGQLHDDGVIKVDLKTQQTTLLISLQEIVNIESNSQILQSVEHKVNHIMISPNGEQFMFLHRYFIGGRRYDRLMTYNFTSKEIKVLASDDMVSHCCWLDEHIIIGYLRDRVHGDKYYQIDTRNGQKTVLGKGIIDRYGDGHPSV